MNIIYDFEIFARQRYGGVSRYFYEVIKGMGGNDNFKIDLFLGLNKSGYQFDDIRNINIEKYSYQYSGNLHFLFYIFNKYLFNKYIKDKKYDIYHKTYYSDIGLNMNCKVISTIHDMTHEIYPEYFSKTDNTSALKKECIKRSNRLICVSEKTKSDLLDMYDINPELIKVIYHGITFKNMMDTGKLYEKPYLLYVGQRWGYKNFNILLSAFASDKNLNNEYNLVCFGGGKFNYSEKLFIKKNNLINNVIQINGNDDILARLYKYASLFVYTSLYEGFGFPPLEAMMYGCPVLSSPGGSLNEVLSDNAVYFDPLNGNDLLDKIRLLLNDDKLKQLMINRGKIRSEYFSWQKSISEHINFYNNIIQ